MKKILLVMSHPDDETFLPGSTVAKYAALGVEIHLLCATRGESGMWSGVAGESRKLHEVREEEQLEAINVLGIKEIDYLDYLDGDLSNRLRDRLTAKIRSKIKSFQPDIVLTLDLLGISGHIDHITMTMAATKAFDKEESVKKLYYFVIGQDFAREMWEKHKGKTGGEEKEITTFVDVAGFLPQKVAAARCYRTQLHDMERLLPFREKYGKIDRFILAGSRVETKFPEKDLFEGII